jgi:hypothetical protein
MRRPPSVRVYRSQQVRTAPLQRTVPPGVRGPGPSAVSRSIHPGFAVEPGIGVGIQEGPQQTVGLLRAHRPGHGRHQDAAQQAGEVPSQGRQGGLVEIVEVEAGGDPALGLVDAEVLDMQVPAGPHDGRARGRQSRVDLLMEQVGGGPQGKGERILPHAGELDRQPLGIPSGVERQDRIDGIGPTPTPRDDRMRPRPPPYSASMGHDQDDDAPAGTGCARVPGQADPRPTRRRRPPDRGRIRASSAWRCRSRTAGPWTSRTRSGTPSRRAASDARGRPNAVGQSS